MGIDISSGGGLFGRRPTRAGLIVSDVVEDRRGVDRVGSQARAVTTPFWDGLLTGGLSLVGMSAILLYVAFGGEIGFVEANWFALAILINSPHFMASYRLLYSSAAEIRANPWSTIYVPAALVAILGFCFFAARPGALVQWLVLISSIYLAWHYTGQTWGMVASFSHLHGVRYSDRERFLIRSGPRSLLVLHVLFALTGRLPPGGYIAPDTYVAAYSAVFVATCATIGASVIAGGWAFVSAYRRGEQIPIQVILPWASLFLWYPFWYFVPGGFFWLQLSHALQYLAFPLRVEVNRYSEAAPRTPGQRNLWALLLYAGLVLVGAVILHGPPIAAHAFGDGWYSTPRAKVLLLALTTCIAIHHFFIDGAVWKLRNPRVRQSLFSHVETRTPV
ncbi:MAG: hypothetical protein GY910_21360 [bacterium]|nr:hypothetical protein [bacterium]